MTAVSGPFDKFECLCSKKRLANSLPVSGVRHTELSPSVHLLVCLFSSVMQAQLYPFVDHCKLNFFLAHIGAQCLVEVDQK